MGVFKRKKPGDVLFLMPVSIGGEKLPGGKVRLLYADTAGNVFASVVSRTLYQLARETADLMERSQKPYAIIGLETGPGKFLPTAVAINDDELWALDLISEHALRSGRLPDILKKYIGPIIATGEGERAAALLKDKERRRRSQGAATPRVMERLPYYPEKDIEFSMPIYKARHSYPFIVLKRLPPDNGSTESGRLLILDNDGDLGVIKLPLALVKKMERNLKEHNREGGNFCAVIAQDDRGTSVAYLAISQQQRKSLDTITRYYEETGSGKQPISVAARAVLSKARSRAASSAE